MALLNLALGAMALPSIKHDVKLQAGSEPTISRYNMPYIATKMYTCASEPSVIDNLYVVLNSDTRTCDEMEAFGWSLIETYSVADTSQGTVDTDNLVLYRALNGDCTVGFHGADLAELYTSNIFTVPMTNDTAVAPTSFYGEDMGFMTLATEELEGLFGKIRAKHGSLASMFTDASCTGELYVTGFSMGGALAQIFSYMANLPSDPLKLHVNVAELYLFGSMPSAMTPLSNGQSADGCFKGTSYYNLVPAGVAAGYNAYADPVLMEGGKMMQMKIKSQSLITTGDIKYLASIAGPGAETVCGEVPAVYTAMAANSTLMAKAKADTLIYLGATVGTHEILAYAGGLAEGIISPPSPPPALRKK